jgi:hypothetical protein
MAARVSFEPSSTMHLMAGTNSDRIEVISSILASISITDLASFSYASRSLILPVLPCGVRR